MKLTIFTICFFASILSINCKPTTFKTADGFEGVIETSNTVNGIETSNIDPKLKAKAEEVIKSMIHKHLNKKKQDKKLAKKEKVATPEKVEKPKDFEAPKALPESIKWDDHKEARDTINQRVPGGTEAVDALLKLIHETQAQK